MQVFSVFDVKAAAFSTPFFSKNKFTAIRDFQNAVNDENTMLAKHPEDYILYDIGSFDEFTGALVATSPPVHLGLASQYII